jgi:hypothetical protein
MFNAMRRWMLRTTNYRWCAVVDDDNDDSVLRCDGERRWMLRTTNYRWCAMVDDDNDDGVLRCDGERRCSMRAAMGA